MQAVERHNESYRRHAQEAKERGASDERLQEIDEEQWASGREYYDELDATETERLLDRARHYGVPTPSLSNKAAWDEGRYTFRRILAEGAMEGLRRQVEAARRERIEGTVKLLNAVAPIAAIAVGLAATIASCLRLRSSY